MTPNKNEIPTDLTGFPFVSQMKSPRWLPFSFETQIPETYIPKNAFFVQLLDDIEKFVIGNPTIEISTIFWYLTLKRYLKVSLNAKDDVIFNQILTFEHYSEEKLGFSLRTMPQGKQLGKKVKELDDPSILATYYALTILQYLDRITEYFDTDPALKKRDNIFRFLEEQRKNHHSEAIFFWLCCNEILGKSALIYQRELSSFLKSPQDKERELFRLLCLHLLEIRSNVNQDNIAKFHQYEKPTGGFTFQNNAYADINESFWIGYTIAQYQWLLPQPTGNIFSFIINELLKITSDQVKNETTISEFAQLIVLLVTIWTPLIGHLEMIIFEGISSQGLLDFNVLSTKSGMRGAEVEILEYINHKYNFKLSIKEITVIFNQFLHDLDQDPYIKEFVIILYDNAQKFAEFDISEIRQKYNKGKKKKSQITDEFLIKILQKMMDQHFFTGKIFPRSRGLFFTRYYFIRTTFVERVIMSDRPISIEAIKKEKERLQVVKFDIYNFTREIENCAENIYREIESLIIAEDVDNAKDRLQFNLTDALNNARFLNVNVEAFKAEFSLINPDYALNPVIEKWKKAKLGLQHESNNLSTILMAKILDLQEDQKQHKATLSLEETVNKNVNEMSDLLNGFLKQFRDDIATKYSRKIVKDLENYLKEIDLRLNQMDQKIAILSKQIVTRNDGISKLRKKSIDHWVSEKEEFQKTITFYQDGIQKWADKVKKLDDLHKNFVARFDEIGKKIDELLAKNLFNDALKINETEFTQIAEEINKVGVNLKNELEPLYKQSRKLISLYQKIPTEWTFLQSVLNKIINGMREQIGKYIQRDLKLNLLEEFRILIENETIAFRKSFEEFENEVNSLIMREESLSDTQILSNFRGFKQKLTELDTKIRQKYQDSNPKIPEFASDMKQSLTSWDQFLRSYQTEFNHMEMRIEEELIISGILELAKKRLENVFTIQEIASLLQLEPSKVEAKLKELISADRINAKILPDSTLEVHNEDWRKWERLKQFKEVFLRELQGFSERVLQIFTKALESKNFIQSIPQLKSFIGLYSQKIQGAKQSYDQYVKDYNINLEHKLIQQTDAEFHKKMGLHELEISNYLLKCDRAVEYQEFLIKIDEELNDLIHREIHNINQSLNSRNLDNYERNMKWFEEQKANIETQIDSIEERIETKKKELWGSIADSDVIITAIHLVIDEQMNEYIRFFDNACSEIEKKLSQNEINKMGKEMESIINEKQDHLNQLLYQMELEVHHRISLKEFKIASKHLSEKTKVIVQNVRLIEKDIKAKNKIFIDRSKVFSIQNKFLIAQWTKFREDYEIKIKERIILLENNILEGYVKYVIKSFKGQYILIKMISDEVLMNHNDIIKRLVDLVGTGRLQGKIDLKLDIYYESEDEIDQKTVESLEIINATNVKAYLTLNRIANIAKNFSPIVGLLVGLISLSSLLAQEFTNILITAGPWLVVALLIGLIWLKKGKDKAIEHKII